VSKFSFVILFISSDTTFRTDILHTRSFNPLIGFRFGEAQHPGPDTPVIFLLLTSSALNLKAHIFPPISAMNYGDQTFFRPRISFLVITVRNRMQKGHRALVFSRI
jgi:hypothetical protein